MSTERSWWTPYLYATLFGCTATIVEVVSKTSLVGQLVAEKHQVLDFIRTVFRCAFEFCFCWPVMDLKS